MRWWHVFRGHRVKPVWAEFSFGGVLFGERCSCGKEWTL